ncbi:MAG: hypothetical protein LUE65_05980 [Clostridiales bacterium]|nr:hypothetical protein [Clostridiales bacterium]
MELKKASDLHEHLDEAQFRTMMERIEASNAGQEKYAKKQYRMSQITAIASVLVLAIVIYVAATLIPQINNTFQNLDLIMKDLNVVTSELADADLEQMFSDVDQLVVSSEKGIQDALEKVNAIDIEHLNEAIQNLNDTVTPLAEFFNRFR